MRVSVLLFLLVAATGCGIFEKERTRAFQGPGTVTIEATDVTPRIVIVMEEGARAVFTPDGVPAGFFPQQQVDGSKVPENGKPGEPSGSIEAGN